MSANIPTYADPIPLAAGSVEVSNFAKDYFDSTELQAILTYWKIPFVTDDIEDSILVPEEYYDQIDFIVSRPMTRVELALGFNWELFWNGLKTLNQTFGTERLNSLVDLALENKEAFKAYLEFTFPIETTYVFTLAIAKGSLPNVIQECEPSFRTNLIIFLEYLIDYRNTQSSADIKFTCNLADWQWTDILRNSLDLLSLQAGYNSFISPSYANKYDNVDYRLFHLMALAQPNGAFDSNSLLLLIKQLKVTKAEYIDLQKLADKLGCSLPELDFVEVSIYDLLVDALAKSTNSQQIQEILNQINYSRLVYLKERGVLISLRSVIELVTGKGILRHHAELVDLLRSNGVAIGTTNQGQFSKHYFLRKVDSGSAIEVLKAWNDQSYDLNWNSIKTPTDLLVALENKDYLDARHFVALREEGKIMLIGDVLKFMKLPSSSRYEQHLYLLEQNSVELGRAYDGQGTTRFILCSQLPQAVDAFQPFIDERNSKLLPQELQIVADLLATNLEGDPGIKKILAGLNHKLARKLIQVNILIDLAVELKSAAHLNVFMAINRNKIPMHRIEAKTGRVTAYIWAGHEERLRKLLV